MQHLVTPKWQDGLESYGLGARISATQSQPASYYERDIDELKEVAAQVVKLKGGELMLLIAPSYRFLLECETDINEAPVERPHVQVFQVLESM